MKVILEARKSIILFDNKYWARENTSNLFDITMGLADSAQVTGLDGIYILSHFTNKFSDINDEQYRDNVLFF